MTLASSLLSLQSPASNLLLSHQKASEQKHAGVTHCCDSAMSISTQIGQQDL